ncbi:hydroxymethylglutaryl-CoA reductase [Streptomyces sp. NPDC056169]|uniref:hydroxymethylglutaryl-CoA reductase n=1 Tax=Streptomyces sp. NPDC056169 TaxID=3345734 RepID=UPI0035E0B12C
MNTPNGIVTEETPSCDARADAGADPRADTPAEARADPRADTLADEIVRGARSLHALPADLSADETALVRRTALARRHGVALPAIGDYSMGLARARCENVIGAVQVPLGVAGPLLVHGERVRGEEVYVPLATTEGALIASVARGCRALGAAGGVTVRAEDVGITRAPVFATSGIEESHRLVAWVGRHLEEIRALAATCSPRLHLEEVRPQAVGTSVYLRFRFTTGDAMGMNMATIACERIVRELIEPATGARCVALSGNYCTDKKPAAVNLLEGRGKRVFAEARLDAEVLARVLHTDQERLCEVQYRKNLLGSAVAGALGGFNAHYANMVAAFFLATGQDIAQVAEACQGITCVEPHGDGVYVSVFLPDAPLAAVGGGTGLDTQREALALLGIHPGTDTVARTDASTEAVASTEDGHDALRLAEILGAVVLAGELNLLAALSSGALASAHQRLGRPVAR